MAMGTTGTLLELEVQFDRDSIKRLFAESVTDFSRLNIEELWKLISGIEKRLGVTYLRMDFGVPGLPAPPVALKAQVDALSERGVASLYPPYDGVPALKDAASRFVRRFLGLDVAPDCCIPTCGATQGSFIVQAVAGRRVPEKDTVLFLDPGYPPMKAQTRFLGLKSRAIDLYHHRGWRLIEGLNELADDGRVAAICWSSPNNPSWNVLSDEELSGIAKLCEREDIIAIEDATYLGMDFRYKFNGEAGMPYPPCIARHTANHFLLLSASKMFSYAGERIGLILSSPALMERNYAGLEATFGTSHVRRAINKSIFNLTAGAPHSAQYGVAALLSAVTDGEFDLSEELSEYSLRAEAVRGILLRHGFHLIYDVDASGPLQHGFYFTFGYPGFSGVELLQELLYYGLTALPLEIFGSCRTDGLRACVALVQRADLPRLEERVARFHADH